MAIKPPSAFNQYDALLQVNPSDEEESLEHRVALATGHIISSFSKIDPLPTFESGDAFMGLLDIPGVFSDFEGETTFSGLVNPSASPTDRAAVSYPHPPLVFPPTLYQDAAPLLKDIDESEPKGDQTTTDAPTRICETSEPVPKSDLSKKARKAASNKKYQATHKEQLAAKQKARYKANKEQIAAKQKASREIHKEKIAARSKLYRETHKEKIASSSRAYHKANKEKMAAKEKAYRETHKEQIAAQKKARREKLKLLKSAAQTASSLKRSGEDTRDNTTLKKPKTTSA